MTIRPTMLCFTLILAALFPVSSSASSRNFDVGDRLPATSVYTTSGEEKLLTFENPSIVVLWATWSSASLMALKDVLEAAPKGGVRWQLVPINVDSPTLDAADTARIQKAARDAGWIGPVIIDRGYRLMDDWGAISIPTVAFTALGGSIDEIEHNWTPSIRDRLLSLYLGAITDSFPGTTTPQTSPNCRASAAAARALWRADQPRDAILKMRDLVDSCPGQPNDIGRLCNWMWSGKDSLLFSRAIMRVSELGRQNAWTLSARAGLAQRHGECSTAVGLCNQALSSDSAFFPAWMIMAECDWQLHDSTVAVVAYDRARALNRFDSRVLAMGSVLADSRGNHVESARLMRAAIERRHPHLR